MSKPRPFTTTADHRPLQKEFLGLLQTAARREGWRDWEAMDRWIEAAFRALRGRVVRGEEWDKNEAAYMALVGRLREPAATMNDFSIMLAKATIALGTRPSDFIGPIFSEISASADLGQFFTPHEVCMLMARITIGDAPATLEKCGRDFLMLSEPTCGVGGMMLATNMVLREQGIDVARQAHWVAVDVDFRAMAACYVQLCLTGSSATLIHGDTLRLTEHMVTPTHAAVLFPKRIAMQASKPSEALPVVPLPAIADRRGQFTLQF